MLTDFTFKERFVLADHPEYQACLDVFHRASDGAVMPLLRFDAEPFWLDLEAMRRLKHEWLVLRQCVRGPLFVIEDQQDDTELERFVRRLGFKYVSRVNCTDGSTRRVFVSFRE